MGKGVTWLILAAVAAHAHEIRQISTSSLNVRSGPGTGYSIIGTVYQGQKYASLESYNGWYKIYYGGSAGWVSGSYTAWASGTLLDIIDRSVTVRSSASSSSTNVGTVTGGQVYVQASTTTGWKQIYFRGAARWVPAGSAPTHYYHPNTTTKRYYPTAEEQDLFERTVTAEAGGEPYEGQVAVAAVILNRIASPDFPNTMKDVIYQPYQFEAVSTGYIWKVTPTASVKKACRDALAWWDPSRGAPFYFNYEVVWPSWANTKTRTCTINVHMFFK